MNKLILITVALFLGPLTAYAQDLLVFGGYHTQLYGYTDPRYIGNDKGDYLKAFGWFTGAEYNQTKIPTGIGALEHLSLGAAANLFVQNEFTSKSLYPVTNPVIAAQTILSDPVDRAARFQLGISAFGGFQEDWWGAEAGLSVFLKGYNETSRLKYDPTGTIVNADGRGWVFDNSLILPNFKLRIGAPSIPHFILYLFRGEYDPIYGVFGGKVVVPLKGFGAIIVGGSLYQTASIYLEPMFSISGMDFSIRTGTVLNYYDSAFTRVGIFEGAFLSGSVQFHW